MIVARARVIYGRYGELERSFDRLVKKLEITRAPKGDKPR